MRAAESAEPPLRSASAPRGPKCSWCGRQEDRARHAGPLRDMTKADRPVFFQYQRDPEANRRLTACPRSLAGPRRLARHGPSDVVQWFSEHAPLLRRRTPWCPKCRGSRMQRNNSGLRCLRCGNSRQAPPERHTRRDSAESLGPQGCALSGGAFANGRPPCPGAEALTTWPRAGFACAVGVGLLSCFHAYSTLPRTCCPVSSPDPP